MRALRFLVLLPLVVVLGCHTINESSAKAGREQIETRLAAQLHCQTLDLKENSKNSFSGTGKNDTGEFTLDVTRQGWKIAFHGVYAEPGKGTFSGSTSWSKRASSVFGTFLHFNSEAAGNSLGTP